ncbi:MAG: c-type cytochrome [Deltaproteobacteria bacterium]|nr:c-type cytochrome [Deltaproteobacteria bacterium]
MNSPLMADGKATFETKCKACHGIDAKGSEPIAKGMKVELKALDLTDDTKGKAETDLAKVVTDGQGGKMPSFKGKLDDAQILEVVKYLKGL